MRGLGDIVGQARAVGRLRGALAAGKPHHAYLFDGPEGVGKRATALAFAQALNCDPAPGEGCGACDPCRKIAEGLHPDVVAFEVVPEKGQSERARELLPRLAYPPHEGRARVVLFDPADELNATAANVLLKTLEEPPPRTHFVLITALASSLLVTIRSRCQAVRFQPLSDAVVIERLQAVHDLDAESAAAAAALAGGSLGRALAHAASEEVTKRRELAARLLAAAAERSPRSIIEVAGELGDRDEAEATLDLLWLTYRDAVHLAEGQGEGRVAAPRWREAAALARRPTVALLAGLRAVEEARGALRGYTSPALTLENLLLRLARLEAA